MVYVFMPPLAWLISGTVKFIINFIRFGSEARQRMGNGGFPSTHTTVITATIVLIGFREGFATPIFSLGLAFLLLTVIDAMGLRRAVGAQAAVLNRLVTLQAKGNAGQAQAAANRTPLTLATPPEQPDAGTQQPVRLREQQGHTPVEVMGGLALGVLLGYLGSLLPF